MMTRKSLAYFASFSIFASIAAGCAAKNSAGDGDTSATEEADSADSSNSSGQSTHFAEMFTGSVQSSEPEAAATGAAVNVGMWPAGCATRAADPTNPRVVHVTFNGCTGPFGLVSVSGEMTATFSKNADGSLHVDVQSTNLTANGHPVSHSGAGDITVNGTERDVVWHGDWTRVNKLGETVAHTTSFTIAIDTATKCRDTNGTAVTTVADREVDSTVTNYKICKVSTGDDACPSGTIALDHKKSGRTITVAFDGSAEATLTGPRGGTISVPLVCGQ